MFQNEINLGSRKIIGSKISFITYNVPAVTLNLTTLHKTIQQKQISE